MKIRICTVLAIVILFTNSSCSPIQRHAETIHYLRDTFEQELKVKFTVPYDANMELFYGHGKEYRYWFKDSSVFYVCLDQSAITLNNKNIHDSWEDPLLGHYGMKVTDTVTFSGIDSAGCWKEKIMYQGHVRYGYRFVPTVYRARFNQYLNQVSIVKTHALRALLK